MKFFWYVALLLLALKMFFVQQAQAEAGMIPMDSPVGEIGGRGHWYSLRTMKGELYWTDPAVSSDVTENDDGTYSYLGEAPVSVALVLHPSWDYGREPWRVAIDWVRQAEQMYRNSGVPVRFIVEHIETMDDMPDTVEAAYYAMPFDKYATHGADLVIGLLPHMGGDPYCGIAGVSGAKSVSSCSPKTLAHELGHNFGLYHAHKVGYAGRKGTCFSPAINAKDCDKGTIMSYAGNQRVPLFAAQGYTKDGESLGNEEHTAVEHLRGAVIEKALRWELSQRDEVGFSQRLDQTEETLCR